MNPRQREEIMEDAFGPVPGPAPSQEHLLRLILEVMLDNRYFLAQIASKLEKKEKWNA